MNKAYRIVGAVAAVTVAAALSACGSSGEAADPSGDEAVRGGTLAIGIGQEVSSLDPAIGNPPGYFYAAYEPLIHQTADGEFVPDLATSWGYVEGSGNTRFQLTLREDAKFSDGTAVDAEAVKGSMDYFLSQTGTNQKNAGAVTEITVVDDLTVQLEYAAPTPLSSIELSLSQDWMFGLIISPAGVADPDSLATTSAGAGPYVYDASASTPGNTYVFTPNEHYFNQDAVYFDEVEMRTYTDATAMASALQSGQIDVATHTGTSAAAALDSAGFTHSVVSSGTQWIALENRAEGPLASQEVRQAISYALPREDIAEVVSAGYNQPLSEIILPTNDAYVTDESDIYTHDVDRAQELMASAGYADGFTLALLSSVRDTGNLISTAVKSALAEIGITVEVTVITGSGQDFSNAAFSKEYDAILGGFRTTDGYTLYANSILPTENNQGNVWGLSDPESDELLAQAQTAESAEEQSDALQALTSRQNELQWFVTFMTDNLLTYADPELQNVPSASSTVDSNPFGPVADLAWHYGS